MIDQSSQNEDLVQDSNLNKYQDSSEDSFQSLIEENLSAQPAEKINQDVGAGRGVYISTYGCQMNVNDSERMYSLLEMQNFVPVQTPEEADLILVNSCSIREKAVHKVYSEVGTFRKLKDKKPGLKIGVGGCVGQQEKENLIKTQPMIDFVFGTDQIDNLPQLVAQIYTDKTKRISAKFEHRAPYHVETLVRNPGVATFVNIAKGCDNFCTFCVVPYTRGREKSRPLQHILTDVRTLIKRGVKEVTLIGQNVNSYKDSGVDFADLMAAVATETDIERIRFTTSHPKDFNQKLADTMALHNKKIMEYVHLPFQSGSSRILDRMNRNYTREHYLEKIAMLKKSIPNLVLSTDIIVGFPGETEEDFMDTVNLVHEVGFETIFAFKYSPRPFTKAAKFEDQVDEVVKTERLNRLFDSHDAMAFEMVKAYEGQVLKILVEKADREFGKVQGRSTSNKLVHFLGSPDLIGKTVDVKITKAFPAVFRGELVQ